MVSPGTVDPSLLEGGVTKKTEFNARFPNAIFDKESTRGGFFMVYLAGKFEFCKTVGIVYAFAGIALVTQNYINPAIDTIKKKGIVSLQLTLTLLAFVRHHERDAARLLELGS